MRTTFSQGGVKGNDIHLKDLKEPKIYHTHYTMVFKSLNAKH